MCSELLVDTHLHFESLLEHQSEHQVFKRARKNDVKRMIAIGGTGRGNNFAVELVRKYPEILKASVGYDRSQVHAQRNMEQFKPLLQLFGTIAVGEIGLDFYYERANKHNQVSLFEEMLSCAREYQLPVIVHSRGAEDETISLLKQHLRQASQMSRGYGVLHCFTGTEKFARRLLDLGFYISFSGIITFKNAMELREVAKKAPEDKILIETDSPYLAPEPHRGKVNEPSFLPYTAHCLAEIRQCSFKRIASVTSRNAFNLFWK